MSRPLKAGCIAGGLHLGFLAAVAGAAAHTNGTWGGPESWIYAAMLDLPFYLLFIQIIAASSFLNAHEFLSLLLFFGFAGTAQWFVIAYGASRLRWYFKAGGKQHLTKQ
jgi:hypothetical protein